MIELEFDFELSDEQIEKFAYDLYYNSDFVTLVKENIENNKDEYIRFLEEEGQK